LICETEGIGLTEQGKGLSDGYETRGTGLGLGIVWLNAEFMAISLAWAQAWCNPSFGDLEASTLSWERERE